MRVYEAIQLAEQTAETADSMAARAAESRGEATRANRHAHKAIQQVGPVFMPLEVGKVRVWLCRDHIQALAKQSADPGQGLVSLDAILPPDEAQWRNGSADQGDPDVVDLTSLVPEDESRVDFADALVRIMEQG
jgi:hypothetical protein